MPTNMTLEQIELAIRKLTALVASLTILVNSLASPVLGGIAPQKNLGAISDNLKLKSTKDKVLGSYEQETGVIKYAYKTDRQIINAPNEAVNRRNKWSRSFIKGTTEKGDQILDSYITENPKYYQDISGNWWEADYATTTKEAFNLQVASSYKYKRFIDLIFGNSFMPLAFDNLGFWAKVAYAADSTFFPDTTGTNNWDGRLPNANVNLTWSQVVNDTGDFCGTAATDENFWIRADTTLNQYDGSSRNIMGFNTGPTIPTTDTVTAVSISIYPTTLRDTLSGAASANSAIVFSSTTPSSLTTCTNSDYQKIKADTTIEIGRSVKQSLMTVNTWATTTLNATANTVIGQGGTAQTWIAFRLGWDKDNLAPESNGVTWASGALQGYEYRTADGAANTRPYIVVTHTSPAVVSIPKKASLILFE